MERLFPAVIVALSVFVILAGMFLAWRARDRRSSVVALPTALSDAGEFLFDARRVFYVATTLAADPLERVLVKGLKYRGFADIEAFEGGLVLSIAGEAPIAIEREKIISVRPRQLTIDKVVEPGGLLAIEWQSELGALLTVFRVQDARVQSLLLSLNPAAPPKNQADDSTTLPTLSPLDKEN